jgi:hypothetical protein
MEALWVTEEGDVAADALSPLLCRRSGRCDTRQKFLRRFKGTDTIALSAKWAEGTVTFQIKSLIYANI